MFSQEGSAKIIIFQLGEYWWCNVANMVLPMQYWQHDIGGVILGAQYRQVGSVIRPPVFGQEGSKPQAAIYRDNYLSIGRSQNTRLDKSFLPTQQR